VFLQRNKKGDQILSWMASIVGDAPVPFIGCLYLKSKEKRKRNVEARDQLEFWTMFRVQKMVAW